MAPSAVAPENTTSGIPESIQNPAVARTGDLFSLGNRTVAITGGGRGLGIVLAAAVIEAGGDVACLDLLPAPSTEEWATVQKLASARSLQATYTQCDITNEEATKQALEQIAAEGLRRDMPLRGAVTCAGIQQMVPALDYPIDGYRKMLEVK
jgi:NAD(P)-dependent dehydrogenase (short-subunit alcohol dehydrogenase family)